MNFTQEQLTEALRAQLTANGKSLNMSERTLKSQSGRIYGRLDKAGYADNLDAAVAEYLPDFEEFEGNIRKDKSDFVKDWNKTHTTANTRQDEPAKTADAKPAGDGDRLDTLLKEITEMKSRLEARENAERVSAIKDGIAARLQEKGVKSKEWIKAYLSKASLSKDADVETEANDALRFYNLSNAKEPATGGTPNQGGGSGKEPEPNFDDVAAIIKRRRGGK